VKLVVSFSLRTLSVLHTRQDGTRAIGFCCSRAPAAGLIHRLVLPAATWVCTQEPPGAPKPGDADTHQVAASTTLYDPAPANPGGGSCRVPWVQCRGAIFLTQLARCALHTALQPQSERRALSEANALGVRTQSGRRRTRIPRTTSFGRTSGMTTTSATTSPNSCVQSWSALRPRPSS
jgi:hypothetical protein